jgi:hypothetical protein
MLPYIFVLLAIAVRFLPFMGPLNFLPHVWHFTPLAASLLFFGARASRRQIWVPLVSLMATDVILTRFAWKYPFTWDTLLIWAWYAAILWLGTGLRGKSSMWRVVVAAAASSLSFFVISNFGVWAATLMYPKTLAGLVTCYEAAIPFFRNTAVSDMVFSLAFFAVPALQAMLSDGGAGDHSAAA